MLGRATPEASTRMRALSGVVPRLVAVVTTCVTVWLLPNRVAIRPPRVLQINIQSVIWNVIQRNEVVGQIKTFALLETKRRLYRRLALTFCTNRVSTNFSSELAALKKFSRAKAATSGTVTTKCLTREPVKLSDVVRVGGPGGGFSLQLRSCVPQRHVQGLNPRFSEKWIWS